MRHKHAHVTIDIGNEACTKNADDDDDDGFDLREADSEEKKIAEEASRNSSGGGGGPVQDKGVSLEEYLDTVYKGLLLSTSAYPRKSDLLHGMFESRLTTTNEYNSVIHVETILWMTHVHVLVRVLLFNYHLGNLPFYSETGQERVHEGNLQGIAMLGFPDVDVRRIVELVWNTFKKYSNVYKLYNDDGTLIDHCVSLVVGVGGGGDDEEDDGAGAENNNNNETDSEGDSGGGGSNSARRSVLSSSTSSVETEFDFKTQSTTISTDPPLSNITPKIATLAYNGQVYYTKTDKME